MTETPGKAKNVGPQRCPNKKEKAQISTKQQSD